LESAIHESSLGEKRQHIMSIKLNMHINNVFGQKAEFLVLNVAVHTQNIVFTEKMAWALHMTNLIRECWGN